MKIVYEFRVTCVVDIEADSLDEAREIFAERYSDNLNLHVVAHTVTIKEA
jgi:hypothetical protein